MKKELHIKLNSHRIIEIEIQHKAFINHPELFDKDKIFKSIKKMDEALNNNSLLVSITNTSYGNLGNN